jgi:Domain of unknown function (DUF4249)
MSRSLIDSFIVKAVQLILILLSFCSCEEKIMVNLEEGNPKVVIEGYITNSNNPGMLKLFRSQEFFNQSLFTPIENASVQIESQVTTEELSEEAPGYYLFSRRGEIPGRTYTLKVKTGNENFGATVELPYPVAIDTVYFRPGIFHKDSLNVIVEFQDPPTSENYYRIKLYFNRKFVVNDYFLVTDAFTDGKKMVVPIYNRYFAPGDTITVELLNLEKTTWKYFKGLSEALQEGVNSQAPGNPPSNITGGALGIFGAYSSTVWLGIAPGTSQKY